MKASEPKILAILLTLFLALQLFGFSSDVYANESDRAAFNNAYKAYQEAVKNDDKAAVADLALQAYELGEKILDSNSESLANLQYNLANALYRLGEASDAEDAYRETLAKYQKIYGEFSEEVALLYMDIARVQLIYPRRSLSSRNSRAKKFIDIGLDIAEKVHGRPSLEYGELQLAAANLLNVFRTRADFSSEYLEEARETFIALAGEDSVRAGIANYQIAREYLWSNRRAAEDEASLIKAKEYLEQALLSFPESRPEFEEWRVKIFDSLQWVAGLMGNEKDLIQWCDLSPKIDAEGGDIKPQLIDWKILPTVRVEPIYPQRAAAKGVEGKTIVQFDVELLGTTSNIKVIDGENAEFFSEASITAVEKWKFKPSCGEDGPTKVEGVETLLTFRLLR